MVQMAGLNKAQQAMMDYLLSEESAEVREIFARWIRRCHRLNPSSWSLNLGMDGRLKLIIGQFGLGYFSLGPHGWLSLNRGSGDFEQELRDMGADDWEAGSGHGYYGVQNLPLVVWINLARQYPNEVEARIDNLVAKVLTNSHYWQVCRSDVLELLRVMGHEVPNPVYVQSGWNRPDWANVTPPSGYWRANNASGDSHEAALFVQGLEEGTLSLSLRGVNQDLGAIIRSDDNPLSALIADSEVGPINAREAAWFVLDVVPGDRVVAIHGTERAAFGEFVGEYEYRDGLHMRPVEWQQVIDEPAFSDSARQVSKVKSSWGIYPISQDFYQDIFTSAIDQSRPAVSNQVQPSRNQLYRSKTAQPTGFWRQTIDTNKDDERVDYETGLENGILLYPAWGSRFDPLELPSVRTEFVRAARKFEGVSDGFAHRLWLFVHGVKIGDLIILSSSEHCLGVVTSDAKYIDGRLLRHVDWIWRSERELPSRVSSPALRGRNLWGFTALEPEEFWRTIDAINGYFHVTVPLPEGLERTDHMHVEQESEVQVDPSALIQRHFAGQGLNYTSTQIADFYTALQAKGFVVLSGISGTGKSRIARHFTELLPEGSIAGEPVIGEEPGDGDVAWTRIQPYNRKYNRLVIPSIYESIFPALDQRVSKDVTLLAHGNQYSGRIYRDNVLAVYWRRELKPVFLQAELGSPVGIRPVYRASSSDFADLDYIELIFENQDETPALPTVPVRNTLFLSVRPDWRDGTSLLGYYNPLTQTYEWTEFLRFIIRAADNARSASPVAWFVILDEMNLAHVEYYFADMLSVLESGRDEQGFTREPLRITFPEDLASETPPQEVYLPPNLYIIGTVNMDETTHAFSPKVLDRAFTMELSDVDFTNYPQSDPINEGAAVSAAEKASFLHAFSLGHTFPQIRKSDLAAYVEAHGDIRDALQRINTNLAQYRFHFGYRVFDEVVQFLANAEKNGMYASRESAFDSAVFMKILPKFSGSEARVGEPLDALIAWSWDPFAAGATTPVLARTHQRAVAMKKVLGIDGFVTAF